MVKKVQSSLMNNNQLFTEAIGLLKTLIATPSFSKVEDAAAALIEKFLKDHEIAIQRH